MVDLKGAALAPQSYGLAKSYTQEGKYVHGLELGHPLDLMKDDNQ